MVIVNTRAATSAPSASHNHPYPKIRQHPGKVKNADVFQDGLIGHFYKELSPQHHPHFGIAAGRYYFINYLESKVLVQRDILLG